MKALGAKKSLETWDWGVVWIFGSRLVNFEHVMYEMIPESKFPKFSKSGNCWGDITIRVARIKINFS